MQTAAGAWEGDRRARPVGGDRKAVAVNMPARRSRTRWKGETEREEETTIDEADTDRVG